MVVAINCDLRSRFGPVRDQGRRPTCLAFALSDSHAAARADLSALSSEFLFFHAQRRAKLRPDQGAILVSAIEALREDGQPIEQVWPYLPALPTNLEQWSPPSPVQTHHCHATRHDFDIFDLTHQLDTGHPVLLMVYLADSFYMPDADGLISRPSSDQPDLVRQHAVVAVGHGQSNGERVILVRNSWGPSWGLAGHGWVPHGYLSNYLFNSAVMVEASNVSSGSV